MPLRFATPASQADAFPLTIGRLLDSAMGKAADQEIVYRGETRMTYRTMRERVGRLAGTLSALGIDEGMTVAVMDWDSHRYLESYFAVPMMGAVLQTVNVRLAPEQIIYTLRHAEARALLIHHDFYPLLEPILEALPDLQAVIAISDGSDVPVPAAARGEYEDLLAQADPDFAFRDFDENAIATTFYTTGTTGDPKGVCFSHRQLVLHSLAACGHSGDTRHRGMGVDDIYMPLTPMFHVHAWGLPYVATMLGLKQVYPGRYDPDALVALRTAEGVTYSHCVPTILQMILAAADRAGADLSGWMMTIGGAALTQALYGQARARGMEIVAGYGMSETAPTISIARPRAGASDDEAHDPDIMTRAGFLIPLMCARIVDEDGHALPADGTTKGELVVRAPWLTQGYTGNAHASEELWRGGWLHTQDVATLDATGLLTIRDRIKDVIKTGGEWICSITLEHLIAGLPGVAEVAVIGKPDARWGERPIAIIVPGDRTPTLSQVNAPIEKAVEAGQLSKYALLDEIEIATDLPRTSVGKIDKKALRKVYAPAPAAADANS